MPSRKDEVDTFFGMKAIVQNIESSVQVLSDRYDRILECIREHGRDIGELKRAMEETEVKSDAIEIQVLKQEFKRLEKYSRHQNLEIDGHGLTAGENILDSF